MLKATIQRDHLLAALSAVLPAVSDEMHRYGLRGVRATVVDGKLELVGCDGCRAHVATIPANAEGERVIFDASSLTKLQKALKAAKPSKRDPEVNVQIEGLTVAIGDDRFGISALNEQYPDLEAVFPARSDESGAPFGVNPAYIADAAKAATEFTGKVAVARIQPGKDALAPMRVDASNERGEFRAVIMPVRM
jgi:DNA polymerase III sliding clamp (beta) subunit (PCNA family)